MKPIPLVSWLRHRLRANHAKLRRIERHRANLALERRERHEPRTFTDTLDVRAAECELIDVGAVAVGVAAILRLAGGSDFHQQIPERPPAQDPSPDTAALADVEWNADRLARSAQHHALALGTIERAGRIGVRKTGEHRTNALGLGFPAGPAEPRRAAHQRAAQE